jgi:hypothetical protein
MWSSPHIITLHHIQILPSLRGLWTMARDIPQGILATELPLAKCITLTLMDSIVRQPRLLEVCLPLLFNLSPPE